MMHSNALPTRRRLQRVKGLAPAVLVTALALGVAACNDTGAPEENRTSAPAAGQTLTPEATAPADTERLPAGTAETPARPAE